MKVRVCCDLDYEVVINAETEGGCAKLKEIYAENTGTFAEYVRRMVTENMAIAEHLTVDPAKTMEDLEHQYDEEFLDWVEEYTYETEVIE